MAGMIAPLRVLLVSTYYHPVIGGAETATQRLAEYLAGAGHHVRLLTRRPSTDVPWTEAINAVTVRRLSPTGPRTAAGKWLWLPWLFAALLREDADVICVCDQRGSGVAVWAAARLRGTPFLIQPQTDGSLDGNHPGKRGALARVNRVLTWPVRMIYARADGVAGIARSILQEGRSLGIEERRLHYLPNTLDTRLFTPVDPTTRRSLRESFGWGPQEIVLMFTGRLSIEKGIRELLEAWRHVAGPDLRLVLVGPEMPGHPWNMGPWIEAFMREHQLERSVTLWGAATPDVLAQLMAAADAAVQPSHFESQGLAAGEAMACGLPVIASAVGGLREFVIDGRNGLLVPPHDVPALAEALREMIAVIRDPRRCDAWRTSARETAMIFDRERVLARFTQVLEELARRRSGAHGI
jgi:glycosyltransferase involved in cell wall biosynthesis